MNHRRARASNWLTDRLGAVVLVLALLTVGQLTWFSYDNRQQVNHDRQITECQSAYNRAVSIAIQQRSQYSDEDRDSLVTFIREISTAKTREASRDALSKYLKRQDEITDARQRHPIPKLPAGECT